MKHLTMRVQGILGDLFGHVEAYSVRGLFFFTWAGICISWNFLFVTLRREGFSGKEIAFILSMGGIIGLFAQPLWGVLADRFGRRRCLRIATILTAAIYFRMYWLHGFWAFFFNAAVLALISASLPPLMDAVALDFVEATGKLSYGMFRIWGAIAAGVGTFGAGYLIEGHATRTAFLWGAGMLVAAIIFGLTGKRGAAKHALEKLTLKAFGTVIRNLPLLGFLLIVFFVGLSSTAFWNFYGVYFTDIGGSSTLFGLAIAMSAVGEIPLYFVAARIFKRFGIQKALLFTFVSSTLRVFTYAFVSNPRIAIWIELSNGISWTLFWIGAVEYVNQLVKPEWRGTGQTLLYGSCFGAGTLVGNLLCGFFLDYSKYHFANPWVLLPVQKLCFASGILFTGVTLASAVYFKSVRQPVAGVAVGVPGGVEDAA
jgi:PPP family 3-phenylpropionic acid transporter